MLEDGELIGRPLSATDAPALSLLLTDPEIGRTLGGVRSHAQVVATFARWREVWRRSGFGPFLFRLRGADPAFVGYAGLLPAPIGEPDDVELLYAILPEFWGRGFATRMSRRVVDWAFHHLEVSRVVAYALTTNLASIGVMAKLGFVHERDVEKAGLPHVFCRLTREDWRAGSTG